MQPLFEQKGIFAARLPILSALWLFFVLIHAVMVFGAFSYRDAFVIVHPLICREVKRAKKKMRVCWGKYVLTGVVIAILAGCQSRPTDRGQQYKYGRLEQPLALVNEPNATGKPVNAGDFVRQVTEIKNASPALYARNQDIFQAIQRWMQAGADTRNLSQFGLNAWQMEGVDNFGIAKRLNFDYTIWTENKLSVSQPISLFLLFACAHLCSIGLRSCEYVGKYSTIYPASMMTC